MPGGDGWFRGGERDDGGEDQEATRGTWDDRGQHQKAGGAVRGYHEGTPG